MALYVVDIHRQDSDAVAQFEVRAQTPESAQRRTPRGWVAGTPKRLFRPGRVRMVTLGAIIAVASVVALSVGSVWAMQSDPYREALRAIDPWKSADPDLDPDRGPDPILRARAEASRARAAELQAQWDRESRRQARGKTRSQDATTRPHRLVLPPPRVPADVNPAAPLAVDLVFGSRIALERFLKGKGSEALADSIHVRQPDNVSIQLRKRYAATSAEREILLAQIERVQAALATLDPNVWEYHEFLRACAALGVDPEAEIERRGLPVFASFWHAGRQQAPTADTLELVGPD